MAANIQYFSDRLNFSPRRDNEVCVFSNDQLLDTSCRKIGYALDYSIDLYTTVQDDLNAPINTFGDFSPLFQMWYDSYSNGYDQGWWDNSNFNYATGPMGFQQQESEEPSSTSGISL